MSPSLGMSPSLEESVVLISSKDTDHIGTGFIIYHEAEKTYLLTCTHVIKAVGGEDLVQIYGQPAEVIASSNINDFDLALLQVEHNQLENRPVLKVYDSNPQEIEVQICGYYLYSEEKKLSLDTIEGFLGKQKFRENPKGKRALVWELNIQDNGRLKRGYSGSPVVDKKSGKVIGMVTNMGRKIEEGDVGEIISVATLKQIYPPIWEKISPSIGEVVEQLPDIKTPVSFPDDIKKRQGVKELADSQKEEAKVFISYPREEEKIVRELKRILKDYNISSWIYAEDLVSGEAINDEIRKNIQESDYFLILLTQNTKYSQEVSRQLGLAFDLQKQNNNTLPQIRAINYGNLDQNSQIIPIKDFETKEDTGEIDFSKYKNYDSILIGDLIDNEQLKAMVNELHPQITFIRNVELEKDLLDSSCKSYEKLFPDEGERDDPEYIKNWLSSSHSSDGGFPGELYAVFHFGKQAVGMAYASCDKERPWCFVSYFGIERTYRQQYRANRLFKELQKEIKKIKPDILGIIGEVQAIDFSLLTEAEQRNKILLGVEEDEKILHNLRAVRRLKLFQIQGALTVVYSDDGSPFPYKQPALRPPLTSENERDFFLIVYLFDQTLKENIRGEEILDCIYDMYREDYGEDSPFPLRSYKEYIDTLKKSLKSPNNRTLKLGKFYIPPFIHKLTRRLKDEGIDEEQLKL